MNGGKTHVPSAPADRSSTRARFLWVAALGAAGLAAAGAYWGSRLGNAARGSSVAASDSSHWPVGLQVHYDVAWSSVAETVAQDPNTGNEVREILSRINLSADLELTRVPEALSQRVLSARLLEPVIKAVGAGDKPLAQAELMAELKRPFLIYFQNSGRVARLQLPGQLGTTSFSVFKSLASLLQRISGPTGASSWRAVEPDLTGKAEFSYLLSGQSLTKKKLKYVELVQADDPAQRLPSQPSVEVLSSKHVHLLGAAFDAPAQSIDGEEATRVSLAGAFAPMESRTTFSLHRRGADVQRTLAEAETLKVGDWVSASIDQLPPEEARDLDRQKDSVAGRSLQALASSLNELETAVPRNRRAEARIFSSLVSKLRIDPAALAEAAVNIRAGKDQKLLLDALGSVGTPEAQALLLELLGEHRFDHEQTRSSLISLSLTPQPTPGTINGLRALVGDPMHGSQALLGLGSVAHSLAADDPAAAIPIVHELETDLAKAQTPNEQEMALRAVGNAGNALALSTCEEYIVHPHLNVRLGAIACARLIPGPRADTVIAKGLLDVDDHVVQAAILACAQREFSTILSAPLVVIVQSKTSRTLRILATQVLGGWMADHPALTAVVTNLAEHEQDAELRTYAASLIAKLASK